MEGRFLTYAGAVFLAFLTAALPARDAVSKTAPPASPEAPRKAAPAARVRMASSFDASHSEIFSPVDSGPLNYSAFYDSLKERGEVSLNKGPAAGKALEGIKTYIVAGAAKEFTPGEVEALKDFVNKGGNLLVLLHISEPVARLTEAFGVIVSNFVISEKENVIKGESQDFIVKRLQSHPVTSGVRSIAVFGSWGLLAEGQAKTVASTSEKAWADVNRNRTLDKNEPVQSFGIVAVSEFGKGKVVIVADDAPFTNKFMKEADNAVFAENIIDWFAK